MVDTVRTVTDTTWLDATAQAELVRSGEASPEELVEAAIDRIQRVDPGSSTPPSPATSH
jgi:amidase